MEERSLIETLAAGGLDESLKHLYGAGRLQQARERVEKVCTGFEGTFAHAPQALFSAPGRTELGGNHTDHQHGRVLAASVDMDILAAAAAVPNGIVRLHSEGYPLIEVDLHDQTIHPEEVNTSAALIRGVAARMSQLGCDLSQAGWEAYAISDVPGGSGLSSSAAFEVLVGTVFNELYCEGRFTPVELAQIGQYAENVYFGKPCGLMDQTASSVGGAVAIDFADPAAPIVEQVTVDLDKEGYALCILDSGADHADLTGEYASITNELKAVSQVFGKEVLREVPEEVFMAHIPEARKVAGDRAVLRAMHIYADDRRAAQEAQALREGRFQDFLALVRQSGLSSANYLQNVVPTGATREQALMLTIALAEKLLDGTGAVRVHGGGFGGTAQAFVPKEKLESFRTGMEAVFGAGSCHVLTIRPVGGARVG